MLRLQPNQTTDASCYTSDLRLVHLDDSLLLALFQLLDKLIKDTRWKYSSS